MVHGSSWASIFGTSFAPPKYRGVAIACGTSELS
jgi:hypothetical protein